MAATTNLPTSKGGGDLDNIAVTRDEFRNEIGILLEYLAQALGAVGGSYSNEEVKPTEVKLQGIPTIEVLANPATDSADQRIPSTKWVKESGTYVSDTAYGDPVDGQLWVDTSNSSYALKAYNSGENNWDLVSGFASGTRMLFQQTAAPTGWTKDTANDNMALRITSGTPSIVDGNQPFSMVFSQKAAGGTVANHTLSIDELPSHSHGVTDNGHGHSVSTKSLTGGFNPGTHSEINPSGVFSDAGKVGTVEGHDAHKGRRVEMNATHSHSASNNSTGITIQSNGSGIAHSHGFTGTNIDLRINYVDVIIAQKD